MAIEKVQITVSNIQELLTAGLTWLKKDDLGYGSIQEKFQANDLQIATIRKHPALKDLETTARVFIVIDDTKEGSTVAPATPAPVVAEKKPEPVSVTNNLDDTFTQEDSFEAFANL